MSAITDRRTALVAERTALEATRVAIAAGLGVPATALPYVVSQLGQDGSRMHGDVIRDWLDKRLVEIERLLGLLPTRNVLPVANRMNVLGKDLSQYAQS